MNTRDRILYLLARLEGALGCPAPEVVGRPSRTRDDERTLPLPYRWAVRAPEVH